MTDGEIRTPGEIQRRLGEEIVEPRHVFFLRNGGDWKSSAPKLCFKAFAVSTEVGQRVGGVAQAPIVRDAPRRLEREREPVGGSSAHPAWSALGIR